MRVEDQTPVPSINIISEIASIFARGYMRYYSSRRLIRDSEEVEKHVVQPKESEAVTEE